MKIKQLKKDLNLKDKDIAEMFGMNRMTYANSSAKKRYENALCLFSDVCRERWQGKDNSRTDDGSTH